MDENDRTTTVGAITQKSRLPASSVVPLAQTPASLYTKLRRISIQRTNIRPVVAVMLERNTTTHIVDTLADPASSGRCPASIWCTASGSWLVASYSTVHTHNCKKCKRWTGQGKLEPGW